MAQKSADEIRAFVRVFAKALKQARRERDIYKREHAHLLAFASQEGARNAVGAQNTNLLRRLRGLMLFRVIPALRPAHEDLAREIVEIMGLAQRPPDRRQARRGRA